MNTPKSDISIPVLTQIISPTAENAPATSTKKPLKGAVLAASSTPPAFESADKPEGLPGEALGNDWKTLELKLNERVLRQILRRVDFVIEHRVKESLADILQASTDEMVKEIRRGLQTTLEDVIKRAVAQEIARVQSIKE